MSKAKQQRTELDRLVAQLRTLLRRETRDVIEIGDLLIESRKHLEHGEWQPWLAENFDLSYRTALRYVAAAEYVDSKSDMVSLFANLSPTVLYRLAEGGYTEQEEAGILARARAGRRVDQDAASAICDELAPPDSEEPNPPDDADDDADDGAEEDALSAAILDGPPPDVPPPAPILPPANFVLSIFDRAISQLKLLMTKPSAQFASTIHNANDLESIESFIRAVTKAIAKNAGGEPK